MLLNDIERSALEAKINQHPKVMMLAAEKERRRREIAAAAVRLDSDAPWIAARVMSGKELILEKKLIECGIECFVPVRKGAEKRRNHKKIPAEMIPMMTGYVLIRCPISGEALHGILGFEHVINLVGGNEKPYLVQTAMVKLIKGKAQSGAYDWDKESTIQLNRGMRVRIIEGLFAGAVGMVVQAGKKGDAVLEIEFLGGCVPALIPLAMLENL
ncbi:transcription termination/antitermination protein NusG [Paenochrobactrum pullorum]|uniref:transcription termination/antitermination protein NusG n=1 Tax=Paenochrobactrum pullorum TaxID=1324351 RepID=UPI0035BBE896